MDSVFICGVLQAVRRIQATQACASKVQQVAAAHSSLIWLVLIQA